MIEINKNPSSRTLRQFSLAAGAFAAVVGYMTLSRSGSLTTAVIVWTMGASVAILGVVRPGSVRWIYLCTSYLTAPIGMVVSLVVLGIVYFLVVTPTGVVMRLLGHDLPDSAEAKQLNSRRL